MTGARAILIVVLLTAVAACSELSGVHPGDARPVRAREAPQAATNLGAFVSFELDRLEDDLKLAEPQRVAWTAYADKVQQLADAGTRSRFEARTPRSGVSAADQLDQLAASERDRVGALQAIAALGRTLYRLLNAEQKALADRRLVTPVVALVTGVAPATRSEAPERSERRRR